MQSVQNVLATPQHRWINDVASEQQDPLLQQGEGAHEPAEAGSGQIEMDEMDDTSEASSQPSVCEPQTVFRSYMSSVAAAGSSALIASVGASLTGELYGVY